MQLIGSKVFYCYLHYLFLYYLLAIIIVVYDLKNLPNPLHETNRILILGTVQALVVLLMWLKEKLLSVSKYYLFLFSQLLQKQRKIPTSSTP